MIFLCIVVIFFTSINPHLYLTFDPLFNLQILKRNLEICNKLWTNMHLHQKPDSIFLASIKHLLWPWPLIQYATFEDEPWKIEEKPKICAFWRGSLFRAGLSAHMSFVSRVIRWALWSNLKIKGVYRFSEEFWPLTWSFIK